MSTSTVRAEFRTPEEHRADEEIAFSFERHIVTDKTTGWTIIEATRHRHRMFDANADDPNNAIAEGGLNVPFLWNGEVYQINRASHRQGKTTVEATPSDPDFIAEVRRRIDSVTYRTLTFYQGFGFICFPEDYAKYQG